MNDRASKSDQPSPERSGDGDGDEPDRDDGRRSTEIWTLVGSMLASALLHIAFVGVAYFLSGIAFDMNADIEWMEGADELTGLGQQTRDRFAKVQAVDEPVDEDEKSEADEKLEKALQGKYEPPKPPEPAEPDKPDEPEAPKEPKVPPEPAKMPAETTAPQPETSPPQNSEQSEKSPQSEPPHKQEPPKAFDDVASHQALKRDGPNDLPDMRSFAPGNARMTVLVRFDQLRGQPYERVIRKIVRAVPDYRLLLGVPTFDPTRDMDWFFMASPDPRYIQNTFLAVRHNLDHEQLVGMLNRRYPDPPSWDTYEDFPVRNLVPKNPHYRDPRKVLLAADGLAVVAKKKLLPQIAKPLAEDSSLLQSARDRRSDDIRANSGETEREEAPRPMLLDGLARIHRVARKDGTIVLLSARGLVFMMPGVGRLPHFESVRLAVTNPEKPTLDIDLQFKSPAKARQFVDKCPAMRQAIDDAIPLSATLGLSKILRELSCKADEDFVNVHGEFSVDQVTRLGNLAYPFLPRPPVLDELPEPPEPEKQEPASGPDAGPADDLGVESRDGSQ